MIDNLFGKHYKSSERLVPTLHSKENYVVHYTNLQLYQTLGLEVVTIHNILEFDQSPWMKEYVDYCTKKRAEATSKDEETYWKLKINACYGKCLESQRRKIDVRLVTTEKKLAKELSKPTFHAFKIFNEDLAAVHLKKEKIVLNKPVIIGFAVLEFAKYEMYKFHYCYMLPKYPKRLKLLATDTDSFLYEILTHDFFKDIMNELHLYDTSNFDKGHFLYTEANRKKLGLMKSETGSNMISKYAGLQSKVYSFLIEYGDKTETKKTAKGVSKATIKHDLNFDLYRKSLFFNEMFYFTNTRIQRKSHVIHTIDCKKRSLTPFDAKRYVLPNGCDTLALGHYMIPYLEIITAKLKGDMTERLLL
jgi:hypothetical protein